MKILLPKANLVSLGSGWKKHRLFFGLFLDLDIKNGLHSFWRIDGWPMSSDRKMLSKSKGASYNST